MSAEVTNSNSTMTAHSVPALGSQYFAIQRNALAMVGFDLSSPELRLKHPLWMLLLNFAIVSHAAPMVVYVLQDTSDLIKLTDNMANVWHGSLSVMKLVTFVWKRQQIWALLKQLHTLNAEASPGHQQLILEQQSKDASFSWLLRYTAHSNIYLSTLIPLTIALFEYQKGGSFHPRLPLDFNFWTGDQKSIYYWPIFVWSTYTIIAVVFAVVAVDTLYSWFVHMIVAQLKILEQQLALAAEERDGATHKPSLIDCVRRHQLILQLVEQLNRIYQEIIFVKFVLSYLQLCSLAYRFSRGTWSQQMPFRAAFLSYVLFQLSSYCYGGEYLKTQSSDLATSLYASFDWSRVSVSSRRLLLLMIMRAQRPSLITGYMFKVDLSLLLWVCRTAVSYLTMLKTFER